ncbi:hypothetical protein BGY98DRAFT_999099 [Russula aff. rugulosa BPL654]|nr:hypothetical protein BGY98DRAFT_999099 [Russula aff. rugulosa BPL654]
MTQEGPDNQKIHHATAKLHGRIVGNGSGFSMSIAKHTAAAQALQYLRSLHPSDPMFSL